MLRATAHVCKRQHRLSSNALFVRYRKASVPEGGWTNENFVGSRADALVTDIVNVRRVAVARGIRAMAPELTKWFNSTVNEIIRNALDGWRRVLDVETRSLSECGTKAEVVINVDAHEQMWAEAIEQELARAGSTVQIAVESHVTSIADEVFGKVSISLGYEPTPQDLRLHRGRIANRVKKVKRINDTTRTRLRNTIGNAIRKGEPPGAVADIIRKRMPSIASNRAMTIARTELGQSADEATLLLMTQGGVVTHISVIGCEKIERSGPHLAGIPTCNIRNVPISLEGDLQFHPNHTGAIVPAAFKREDGSVLNLAITPGGTYDD